MYGTLNSRNIALQSERQDIFVATGKGDQPVGPVIREPSYDKQSLIEQTRTVHMPPQPKQKDLFASWRNDMTDC
jgi:hypothetical protein